MKVLYFDLGMGAAGDMLTAALYELLDVDKKKGFIDKINELFVDKKVIVSAEESVKCGITGTHFRVIVDGEEEHSHDHHDHVDNLYHLIDNYDVSKVYIPNLDGFGLFSVNKLKEKGVEVIPLEKGDTFEIGGQNCVAEVIYGPDKTSGVSTNDMSLVTMIKTKTRIGEIKYLTGGDIEEYAANKILEQGIDIKADIMKADHHGGGDTPEYIKKVNPSFYIIDYLDKYDSWVQPQVDAADECGNVFSTYSNGEVSFSIKASGNIVPTAQRNVEQVEFNVQDSSGKTYTVT